MLLGDPVKVDDPRTPLQKIRRFYLRLLLDAHGIPYNESTTTAKTLRNLVEENGIDYMNFNYEEARKKRLASVLGKSETKESETKEPVVDYTTFKRPQLMKLCKEMGIKISPKDKREDLIGKLNGENTT